jgi:hypothetical protein
MLNLQCCVVAVRTTPGRITALCSAASSMIAVHCRVEQGQFALAKLRFSSIVIYHGCGPELAS